MFFHVDYSSMYLENSVYMCVYIYIHTVEGNLLFTLLKKIASANKFLTTKH